MFDMVNHPALWVKLIAPDAPDRLLTPVSYTHLRAHETVLDLVCRLLLEKKQKNVYNNEFRLKHRM